MVVCLFHALLFYQVVLFYSAESPVDRAFFLFFAVYKTLVLVGLYPTFQQETRIATRVEKTSRKPWTLVALVTFVYTFSFAIVLALYPHAFGPQGLMPHIKYPDSGESDVQVLALRFQGTTLLAVAFAAWGQRNALIAEPMILSAALYTFDVLQGTLDSSGVTNQSLSGSTLAFHYLYMTFLGFQFQQVGKDGDKAKAVNPA